MFLVIKRTLFCLYSVEKSQQKEKTRQNERNWFLTSRFWLAICTLVGYCLLYAQSVSFSVNIVCMVNHTYNNNLYNVSIAENEKFSTSAVESINIPKDGPFKWDRTIQGHLLAAFYYGYCTSQVPAGILAQKYGAKRVYAIFYFISTVACLLTPLAAYTHYGFVIAARILTGIGTGAVFPSMHALWSNWAPALERSKLFAITSCGFVTAAVVAFPTVGALCTVDFAGGWPLFYYIFGGCSMVWLLVWVILVADSPISCFCIKDEEANYITKTAGTNASVKKSKIPWKAVFTSKPFWAIALNNISIGYFILTFQMILPTYLQEILHFDIELNGLMSSLPSVAQMFGSLVFSSAADKMIASKTWSVGATRKTLAIIGSFGPAIFIIAVGFVDQSMKYLAMLLFTLLMFLEMANYSGFLVNFLDIASNYAAVLVGITNSVASVMGIIGPIMATSITRNQTAEEWRVVFYIMAAITAFGGLSFAFLGSGEVQKWAVAEDEEAQALCDDVISVKNYSDLKK